MAHSQILVLEDKEFVRDIWVDGLEEAGYSVVGMASGTEALTQLPKLNPQLILLDIKMPDMDGIQFLARLRMNPAYTQIPVIIISGIGAGLLRATDRPLEELPELGVVGILQKPVDLETILTHVRRAIGPATTLRARVHGA